MKTELKIVNGQLYQVANKNLVIIWKELRYAPQPLSVLTLSKLTRLHRSNIYDTLRELMFSNIVEEIIGDKGTKLYKIKSKEKEKA